MMAGDQLDVDERQEPVAGTLGRRVSSLFPGGAKPDKEAMAVGGIILGALLSMIVLRRVFRSAMGQHAHVSALDTGLIALHVILFMAVVRTLLSQPKVARSSFGKAGAWLLG
jgi:hypothetical protein